MQSKRNIVDKARDILSLCLRDAINTSLTAIRGEDWFQKFAAEEKDIKAHSKDKKASSIVQARHKNVDDLDLQAFLKILKHRDSYRADVLAYFNIDVSNKGNSQALDSALDNLIDIVRNTMYAHTSVSAIENTLKKDDFNAVYGYDEAMNDIILISRFFDGLKNSDGVPYTEELEKLRNSLKKSTYDIEETIKNEKLSITVSQFITYCTELGADITTLNSKVCFVTSEYTSIIAQIKNKITDNKSKRTPIVVVSIIAAIIVVTGVVLAVVLSNNNPANTGGSETIPATASAQVTTVAAENDTAPGTTAALVTTVPPATQKAEKHIYGQVDCNGSTITIDQKQDKSIALQCSSNPNTMYFGWVNAAYAVLKTDKNIYSFEYPTHPYQIAPYQEGSIMLYYNISDDEVLEYIELHNFGVNQMDAAHDRTPVTINISYK